MSPDPHPVSARNHALSRLQVTERKGEIMKRLFIAASVLAAVSGGWFLAGNGAPKEPRPPLSPEQEKAIDDALDAYIGYLTSFDTVRLEYASAWTETTPDGKELMREGNLGVLTLKKPDLMREESFGSDGRLRNVNVYGPSGRNVDHSFRSGETFVQERSKGPLNGREAEKDSLPFMYYPYLYALSPDLAKRRASLKRLAVSVDTEDLSGVPCRVIAFKGLGTRRSGSSERARLWIGPDGAPVRCLYEDDRQDDVENRLNRVASDTRFTSVKGGVEAPDTLFTFTPPKGGKVLTEEDMMDPARLLLPKGGAAPDITCVDLEGRPVRLSDFRGKLVLLNFWDAG